jgi:hypothetical protein
MSLLVKIGAPAGVRVDFEGTRFRCGTNATNWQAAGRLGGRWRWGAAAKRVKACRGGRWRWGAAAKRVKACRGGRWRWVAAAKRVKACRGGRWRWVAAARQAASGAGDHGLRTVRPGRRPLSGWRRATCGRAAG